jgi:hypothetical protein
MGRVLWANRDGSVLLRSTGENGAVLTGEGELDVVELNELRRALDEYLKGRR